MSGPSSDPVSDGNASVGSGTRSAPLVPLSAASGRARGAIRWVAMASAGASVSALLILEQIQRPGFDVVLFSMDTPQWRIIFHFVFLGSACVSAGTIAHQLTRAPRGLERAVGWTLGPLLILCGIAICLLCLLLIAIASVRQYVTITADDGTQFLVRAKTWHHTDYTVLEPAEEWGPWYTDGASILTDNPNTELAVGEYVLQRTPSGYRLTFGSAPGDGRSYELEW